MSRKLAEGEGFEPADQQTRVRYPSPHDRRFLDRSAILPARLLGKDDPSE